MRVITIILASFFIVACSKPAPTPSPVDPYAALSPGMVSEQCDEPKEKYMFPLFGDVYFILRHSNCGKIPDLFSINWFDNNGEQQKLASKLLTVLYINHSAENLEYEFLKFHEGNEDTPHAAFYRLHTIKEEAGSTSDAAN